MPRSSSKPSLQFLNISPRIQMLIDAIGVWAKDQGFPATRRKRGSEQVVTNVTYVVSIAIERWAKEIDTSPGLRHTVDEMRPYLLEYYNLRYIDDSKITSISMSVEQLAAIETINRAMENCHIPMYRSNQQTNYSLLIVVALFRFANHIGVKMPPLIKLPKTK